MNGADLGRDASRYTSRMAIDKLEGLSNRRRHDGTGPQIDPSGTDAFAEVFANMANASTPALAPVSTEGTTRPPERETDEVSESSEVVVAETSAPADSPQNEPETRHQEQQDRAPEVQRESNDPKIETNAGQDRDAAEPVDAASSAERNLVDAASPDGVPDEAAPLQASTEAAEGVVTDESNRRRKAEKPIQRASNDSSADQPVTPESAPAATTDEGTVTDTPVDPAPEVDQASAEVNATETDRPRRRRDDHGQRFVKNLADAEAENPNPESNSASTADSSQTAVTAKTSALSSLSDAGRPASQAAPGVNLAAAAAASNANGQQTAQVATSQAAAQTGRATAPTGGPNAIGETSVNRVDNALAAKSKAKAGAEDRSATLARVKMIQRVGKAFEQARHQGGVVRMKLAPDQLGSLTVEMKVRGRQVDASVIAESEAAGAVLREHLGDLRQKLESYGMTVERLEVRTESSGQDSGGGPFSKPGSDSDGKSDSRQHQRTDERPQHENRRSINGRTPDERLVQTASSAGGWEF